MKNEKYIMDFFILLGLFDECDDENNEGECGKRKKKYKKKSL